MAPQVLEGTWEEIASHAQELTGRRMRLILLPDNPETPITPNGGMLAALRDIAQRQEGQRATSGEDTQRLLREARNGGMYGLDPLDSPEPGNE